MSSNAPHIKDLIAHDLRFILLAKPGDHAYLFNLVVEAALRGEITELILPNPDNEQKTHCFRSINSLPLNQTSQEELQVNFLEYGEIEDRDEGLVIRKRFS